MNILRSPTVLGLALATVVALGATQRPSVAPPDAPPTQETSAVEGRGLLALLGCAACGAGLAGLVTTGGWAAVVVAAHTPGSTLVVAGCIGACVNAFK